MKIIFALDNYLKYYSIDDAVRELRRRGHEIVIVLGQDKESHIPDDALQKAATDLPDLKIEPLTRRRILPKIVRFIRELLNYAYVLDREEERRWDAKNWGRFFHPSVWKVVSSAFGKKSLKNPIFRKTLRLIEKMIPVAPEIRQHVKTLQPDVLVALPLISGDSRESEYVQAAGALGIPTVFSMFSWDNISAKGTFHSRPDRHIVWNRPLAEELSRLHNIPSERIHITGAPRFHRLIGNTNGFILPREEFCRNAGFEPAQKYILYVGSTYLLDSNVQKSLSEDALILNIADALTHNPQTRDVRILVRPHPVNTRIIPALKDAARPNVTVFPSPGELPDTDEKRRMFYNSIYHSLAVVGVNTTAFLEASALDRPCITIISKEYGETQQLVHFHHLEEGGFLEKANHAEDVARIAANVLAGADRLAPQRREFVRNFIEPLEPGRSAVEVYADLVEQFGSKR
ncbi:MAG: hypothetical protein DCC59_00095 [Chloroflexi bacterium]|nr:hypothetical protein [Chloroflexi bacterium CFX1]MCK6567400.1 hypothetical protein [Anaerolineales bacterium]MCQ3953871.1 hypothetical protein [Chloroflexota bacterium]MDL1918183.1 hypothetical protein [Chloroflexi bacterium CFX5]NUQ60662.1 hypothetical protein [Anaerolineales bacterium]